MVRPLELTLADGESAAAVRVERREDLGPATDALGLTSDVPTLVLVGGADNMSATDTERVLALVTDAVAPAVESAGGVVVDGGTDSGVMRAMGAARTSLDASFPLVGVVVDRLALLPAREADPDGAPLDARHTHFLLVPGAEWGDEAPWLAAFATAIAHGAPSATVLMNGGAVAWRDVECSLAERRPVVVAAGTGRTADEIANASTPAARRLRRSDAVHVVPTGRPNELRGLLATLLEARPA